MRRKNATRPGRAAPPVALTIAGSDSGGGAGIQADLRTFAAFGVHGTSVLTALTAQNTRGVDAIHTPPARFLRAQLDAVFDDFDVGAAKLGMLATPAIARVVGEVLAARPRLPVVMDPVLVATTGARLGTTQLASRLRALFTQASLVTPNIPEAESLLGRRIRSAAAMRDAAARLLDDGARAVLLKGGHLAGERASDLLLTRDGAHWFHQRRMPGEFHGTGCTLSAAIAACLARGDALEDAVATAIGFVQDALRAGYRPGRGALNVLDTTRAGMGAGVRARRRR